MKIYKTIIKYELECVTKEKLSKEDTQRLQHNIEANINHYGMVTKGGKLVVTSQEIEV
jgi:hypothetical protein